MILSLIQRFVLSVLIANVCANSAVFAAASAKRPNILFIFTDDQSHRSVGCYDEAHAWVKTPHIDRLAREGVRFVHAFAGTWCLPSRASILTGLQPHGIRGLRVERNPISRYDPQTCRFWPAELRKAGYTTAMIGKWHLSPDAGHGRDWDHSIVWNHAVSKQAGGYYLGQKLNFDGGPFQPVEGYSTDNYTQYAIDFLRRRHKQPWFLWLCYDAVHSPYTPAARHADFYRRDAPVPTPKDIYPPRPEKPRYMHDYGVWKRNDAGLPVYRGRTLSDSVRRYNRTALALDEGIGRILRALEETGQLDETLIVYTSDQGFAWGQHGFAWKVAPYDANLRVPFLVRLPGRVAQGKTCLHPVGALDLIPTFFALAGVKTPWKMHGHDLSPILKDPQAPWPHPVLLEMFRWAFGSQTNRARTGGDDFRGVPWWLSLRQGRFKYIRTLVENEIEELYDLQTDPEELNNLALDPKHYGGVVKDFRQRLVRELRRTDAALVDHLPPPRVAAIRPKPAAAETAPAASSLAKDRDKKLDLSQLRVFQSKQERFEAGQMFANYQKKQILDSFARREQAVAKISSKDQVFQRARTAREAFIESIGGLPAEKCPLRAKVVGVVERDGYTIEKILYQSRPDFWIAANLYLPAKLEGKKVPAVLTPTGHDPLGKSARWVQERAIGLVRRGLIVLAYDQIGLGERWQYWDPKTGFDHFGHQTHTGEFDPKHMNTTRAHSFAGNQAWLTGDSLAGHVVWDAVRGVDYLLSRAEVDPQRIACSGASMGGLATMVLSAVEPRLKVSVPVSHITRRAQLVRRMMGRDAEQIFLGCYSDGWDHADLLLPMTLHQGFLQIIGNTQDFFPIEGTRSSARELERLFDVVGLPQHFRFVEIEHDHGWCPDSYEALYKFLDFAFGRTENSPVRHEITPADTIDPSRLWCTPEGQVTGATVHSETVFSLDRTRAIALQVQRGAGSTPAGTLRAARRRIALKSLPARVSARQYPTVQHDNMLIEKWSIESEPGIQLPALLLRGKPIAKKQPARAVVYASALGKQTVFDPRRFPLQKNLDRGAIVLAIDVRGCGETRWRRKPDQPASEMRRYTAPVVGEESILTYNALRNGQTMVGQRAFDILAAADWLRQQVESKSTDRLKITLWGDRELGVSALHALAAQPQQRNDAVLSHTLFSYDNWARTRFYSVSTSLIIPGILQDYDLADLASAVSAMRREPVVTWVHPMDASGSSLKQISIPNATKEKR